MKYLKQSLIILLITMIGELIKFVIPIPIPASIYGMIIMFICLLTGIVKLEQVNDVGKFLIELMPVMFIPSCVGLISSWSVLQSILVPVCLITVITLLTVFVVTGRVSQGIIKAGRSKEHE